MGISNTAATLPGFIGPAVAKAIAHEVMVGSDCKQVPVLEAKWGI